MKRVNSFLANILLAVAVNVCFIWLFSATTFVVDKDNNVEAVKISLISANPAKIQDALVPLVSEMHSPTSLVEQNKLDVREVVESNDDLYVSAKYDYGSADNPVPKYPRLAVRSKHQGKVVICVNVGVAGVVSDASICNSSGSNLLDNAALRTIKNWKFQAAKRGDQFVMAKVEIPVVFSLNKS